MTARLRAIAWGLLAIAGWSVAGIVVALALGDTATVWRFLWALIGSGGTLVAIGYLDGRHG